MQRRFPAPWTCVKTPGGYSVADASGRTLAYVYASHTPLGPNDWNKLTEDEARRIAAGIARLPELLAVKHGI
jgi:hypothetical protein